MAECMMAAGVLLDDRPRYDKGVALYRTTVQQYLRWGRGQYAASDMYPTGRAIGEATETLRDVYHTEFGLGSLLQAAETAWVQGQDEYGAGGHALAAAMELHARVINAKAAGGEAALPRGSGGTSRCRRRRRGAPGGGTWRPKGGRRTAARARCARRCGTASSMFWAQSTCPQGERGWAAHVALLVAGLGAVPFAWVPFQGQGWLCSTRTLMMIGEHAQSGKSCHLGRRYLLWAV